VRRWRDRIAPEVVGLPSGERRRAAGLRREELAGLAGISVDYLTRLEQGRATSPSTQVLESLSRALRLTDAERDNLFELVGRSAPGPGIVSTRIPASVQRLLDRLSNTPVAVYDATWNLLLANGPYEALMGQASNSGGIERNSIWRNLVGPGTRTVHTEDEQAQFESLLVTDLRRTAARYPSDRSVHRLVAELTARSPRFVELWESGDATPRTQQSRHKTIRHPAVGPISLDCDILMVAGEDLRIMVYTAEPGSEDAERLDLAIVIGTQELVEGPTV
jgi:transcriptional regulator with XRE-family HTH domain